MGSVCQGNRIGHLSPPTCAAVGDFFRGAKCRAGLASLPMGHCNITLPPSCVPYRPGPRLRRPRPAIDHSLNTAGDSAVEYQAAWARKALSMTVSLPTLAQWMGRLGQRKWSRSLRFAPICAPDLLTRQCQRDSTIRLSSALRSPPVELFPIYLDNRFSSSIKVMREGAVTPHRQSTRLRSLSVAPGAKLLTSIAR
jgi:hypothetical protein